MPSTIRTQVPQGQRKGHLVSSSVPQPSRVTGSEQVVLPSYFCLAAVCVNGLRAPPLGSAGTLLCPALLSEGAAVGSSHWAGRLDSKKWTPRVLGKTRLLLKPNSTSGFPRSLKGTYEVVTYFPFAIIPWGSFLRDSMRTRVGWINEDLDISLFSHHHAIRRL